MTTWVDLNELGRQQARTERSEVDRRRAIVTLYYGYFHRLCAEAALPFARGGTSLMAQVGRGLTHTGMRSVCEVYQRAGRRGGSAPAWFHVAPTPPTREIVEIAEIFAGLQEARVWADYDLSTVIDELACSETLALAQRGHTLIDAVKGTPEFTIFLTALLLADRWTRRG